MILYSTSKKEFSADVISNQIEKKLIEAFRHRIGRNVGKSEVDSWRNSLMYMNNAISDPEILPDVSVALEYKVPNTSFRIDFILAGQNEAKRDSLVVVELKQWSKLKKTEKDGIVSTQVGQGEREVPHPSYQAWSYVSMLQDFNSAVQDEEISLWPCAYLHNCEEEEVVRNAFYQAHLDRAPVFLRNETQQLTDFLKKHVRFGDKNSILYKIDQGKIMPSKHLADSLTSMLKGNQEFTMIDDQKIVFETALNLAKTSSAKNKNVLIVNGGPGTGKSVVAINLLVHLTKAEKTVQYVSKNAAPRAVYEEKLTGSFRRTHISNMFVGSGRFTDSDKNTFDALIVDEAHRLNAKSGMYSNLGENQIKEVIRSSLFSTFFLDEDQRVTFKDIGSRDEVRRWAKRENAEVTELNLSSQFRCSGSNAYLAWIDHTLQIRNTDNQDLGA